jgi:hypothetical protein
MDLKELHQEDIDKVAGGVHRCPTETLETVEDIEASPVFEELKNKIAYYKKRNAQNKPEVLKNCEADVAFYIKNEGGFRIRYETVKEFVQKYLPLV